MKLSQNNIKTTLKLTPNLEVERNTFVFFFFNFTLYKGGMSGVRDKGKVRIKLTYIKHFNIRFLNKHIIDDFLFMKHY